MHKSFATEKTSVTAASLPGVSEANNTAHLPKVLDRRFVVLVRTAERVDR
jgi:hypothetical protein